MYQTTLLDENYTPPIQQSDWLECYTHGMTIVNSPLTQLKVTPCCNRMCVLLPNNCKGIEFYCWVLVI